MTYEELIENHPDFIFDNAGLYYEEATPEMTEQGRLIGKAITGYLLKFMQDHCLTRHVICATALDIPDDLIIYYRDLVPLSLEFDRQAVSKWRKRFERNMHADPSDMRILEKWLEESRSTGA